LQKLFLQTCQSLQHLCQNILKQYVDAKIICKYVGGALHHLSEKCLPKFLQTFASFWSIYFILFYFTCARGIRPRLFVIVFGACLWGVLLRHFPVLQIQISRKWLWSSIPRSKFSFVLKSCRQSCKIQDRVSNSQCDENTVIKRHLTWWAKKVRALFLRLTSLKCLNQFVRFWYIV